MAAQRLTEALELGRGTTDRALNAGLRSASTNMLALILASAASAAAPYEQVRLSLGMEPSVMAVQFVSMTSAAPATVRFGIAPDALGHSATSASFEFTQDANRTWYNHVANMTGLAPSTKYFYQIGDEQDATIVFHFTSQVTPETLAAHLPQRHIVYGDLGTACAFTLCPVCTCNLTCTAADCAKNHSVGLVTEVGAFSDGEDEATVRFNTICSPFAEIGFWALFGGSSVLQKNSVFAHVGLLFGQMILHTGDFAYNMGDDNGRVGDQFFRNIEQIAAYVPYMVSIGAPRLL